MSSDADDKKKLAQQNNNSLFRQVPYLMKVILGLLLIASAIVVRGTQIQEQFGEGGASFASSTTRKTARQSLMMASRSAPMMAQNSAVMEADQDMMEEKEEGGYAGGTSMGGDVLKAWDENIQKLHDKKDTSQVIERMLVHNGHMSLMTWKGELLSVADKVEALVKQDSRGYVESRSSYNMGDDRNKLLSVDLQLRVASQHFSEVVTAIQEIVGEDMVQSVSLNTRDVTDSYVDATSRADTLDASRSALRLLIEKAQNVNEIMSVQRELNRLTEQYESQKSRALNLKSQSDLSSLSVHLQEKNPKDKVDGPKPWWSPAKTLSLALQHMGLFCSFLGDTVVYAMVWAVPLAVVLLLYYGIWQGSKSRRSPTVL